MKKNIALVMGGFSGEHDISIASGNQVYEQLDHTKYNVYKIVVERAGWYWLDGEEHRPIDRGNFTIQAIKQSGIQTIHFDLAFIIVHGNPGENGVLQGYFDMLGIKYTTCGFYTSALTFQKGYCNPVVKSFNIVKVAESELLYSMDDMSKTERLGLPLFVKPAAGGSSVATTKVKNRTDVAEAVRLAFSEDHAVLVEECIVGREFDCGGFSNEVTPAECPESISKHVQEVSLKLYDLLGCKGIVRFDYIHDTAKDELFFLEVNTIPGQSAESIVPKQARAMGISTRQLYEMVIQSCL